jgi:GLPGLI family protein
MNKILILSLLVILTSFTKVQSQEGAVIYTTKINMHKRIPAEQEEMKKMIPEFTSSQNELIFNDIQSLFKPVPVDENPFDQGPGGQRMSFRMVVQNETFLDRDNEGITQLRDFMGKKYIVKSEMKRIPWKLGNETKTINGYACKNAVYTDENQREIVAWYSEDLRVPVGPESFYGLPGLILEVIINNDEMIIGATKIDMRNLKKNELKEPKGGIEISDEEYKAMVKEQMEKMAGQRGQGNTRMFIRN